MPKIDIQVGPMLAVGKLERRALCDCGKPVLNEDVPLGKRYNLDLRSVRWAKWTCAGCGKVTTFRAIDAWDELLVPHWTFLDLFDLDRKIAFSPIPSNWVKVKDNLLAPAHARPGRVIA